MKHKHKHKLVWFPVIATLLIMVILYTIGNTFEISFMSWNFSSENSSEGFVYETSVSFIPIIIAFIVGFITERILKSKYQRNSNLV